MKEQDIRAWFDKNGMASIRTMKTTYGKTILCRVKKPDVQVKATLRSFQILLNS